MLTGLNHITIAVADLERSFEFYVSVLGFQPKAKWAKGAYLVLGELWLALSLDSVSPSSDYTHIAFSVDAENFSAFRSYLEQHKLEHWKENSSEGDSLYILDPDQHKLEIHVGDLNTRLHALAVDPYDDLVLYS